MAHVAHPCFMLKANGRPCTYQSYRTHRDTHPEHLHFCGTHKNVYQTMANAVGADAAAPDALPEDRAPVNHTVGLCLSTVREWGGTPFRRRTVWCPNPVAEGSHLCAVHTNHQALRAQAPMRLNRTQIIRNITQILVDTQPLLRWRNAILAVVAMNDVSVRDRREAAWRYYLRPEVRQEMSPRWRHGPIWRFALYWDWAIGGQQGPEPNLNEVPDHIQELAPPVPEPPRQELRRLAGDSQNVHTRPVTDQTNAATDKLLAVKVPELQQTEKKMALVWLESLNIATYGTYLRVANDVNRWFNTKDCRVVGDHLYRKLLRGAVGLIAKENDAERRLELYRRLWEECNESVGMCCEGHISRICNVFVGFDEAFKPPVSFGEILQSKMAAIAGLDIPDEEKRRQANAFFDENGTPAEERVAWLDAF